MKTRRREWEFGDPGEEASPPIKARWQAEVRRLIALMASHEEPYRCRCAELDVTVMPQVFSPAYFTDSEWFAVEIAAIARGRRLLDIGTGTGIVALAAAVEGASVVVTDINPAAVENARLNLTAHGIVAPCFGGDVYDALVGDPKFDVVFWNHPFNFGTDQHEDPLSLCGFDFGYGAVRRFIEEGPRHVAPGGRLILGTSTFAEAELIERIALGAGLRPRTLMQKTTPLQWRGAAVTELRIVEFVPLS